MSQRWLLVGNYGVGNLGDEALKEYFVVTFPEINWQVLSANPGVGELPRLPSGVRSLLGTRWWCTLRAMRAADGLVFGGGSLFTDVESVWACVIWGWHAWMARVLGKPVLLAYQGIGPFRTRLGQWIVRWIVKNSFYVSVRDAHSFDRLKRLNLNKNVIQSFDPVLSLIDEQKLDDREQNILVVIPRGNATSNFTDQAIKLANEKPWHQVFVLSLQPEERVEREYIRVLLSKIDRSATALPVRHLNELTRHLQQATQILSARFHGSLAARVLDRPLVVSHQVSADKHDSLVTFDVQQAKQQLADGENTLRQALNSVAG